MMEATNCEVRREYKIKVGEKYLVLQEDEAQALYNALHKLIGNKNTQFNFPPGFREFEEKKRYEDKRFPVTGEILCGVSEGISRSESIAITDSFTR